MGDIIKKPWGWYENLDSGSGYLVKKLHVEPDQRLSCQYHKYRTEQWYVVSGNGLVELGPDKIPLGLSQGMTVTIFHEQLHRLIAGSTGITVIEIQQGTVISETDIVRISDDYGRV